MEFNASDPTGNDLVVLDLLHRLAGVLPE